MSGFFLFTVWLWDSSSLLWFWLLPSGPVGQIKNFIGKWDSKFCGFWPGNLCSHSEFFFPTVAVLLQSAWSVCSATVFLQKWYDSALLCPYLQGVAQNDIWLFTEIKFCPRGKEATTPDFFFAKLGHRLFFVKEREKDAWSERAPVSQCTASQGWGAVI